jgi:hydroxymethylbilane synthase
LPVLTAQSSGTRAGIFLQGFAKSGDGLLQPRRPFLRVLDGSCKTPIGAFACLDAGNVAFHAIVLKPDGSRFFETAVSGPLAEAALLGETAGRELAVQIPAGFFER